uniref:Uncharacterized protein n=1 Tax=Anguilla anguilla TaxID=7936 RepID=A0A0E9TQZ5_ANGAN
MHIALVMSTQRILPGMHCNYAQQYSDIELALVS